MIIAVLTVIANEGPYFSKRNIYFERIKDGNITTQTFLYFSFENSMRVYTYLLPDPCFLE